MKKNEASTLKKLPVTSTVDWLLILKIIYSSNLTNAIHQILTVK